MIVWFKNRLSQNYNPIIITKRLYNVERRFVHETNVV